MGRRKQSIPADFFALGANKPPSDEENKMRLIENCASRSMIYHVSRFLLDELGTGHKENIYKRGMVYLLNNNARVLATETEKPVPIDLDFEGKEVQLGIGYIDVIASFKHGEDLPSEQVIIEIKCARSINEYHGLQIRKYMKGLRVNKGLVVNFRDGSSDELQVEVVDI
jgi:GxxExxY protein